MQPSASQRGIGRFCHVIVGEVEQMAARLLRRRFQMQPSCTGSAGVASTVVQMQAG